MYLLPKYLSISVYSSVLILCEITDLKFTKSRAQSKLILTAPETESTETSTMKTESDGEADNEDDDDSSSENEMAHLPVRYYLGFANSLISSSIPS